VAEDPVEPQERAETGNPVAMKMEGPPPGMTEAVQKALAEKPWLK
jgi:hypothetical protein